MLLWTVAAMLPVAAFAQKVPGVVADTGQLTAEWPDYRGRDGRAIDDSKALPTNWDVETGENIRWKTAIPGRAHSSPILWGDRVYVSTALMPGNPELSVGMYGEMPSLDWSSQQWRLLALDSKTGKVIWKMPGYEGITKIKQDSTYTLGPSTPATDGKHIAAIFGSEGLVCFDMEGKALWQKDLGPTIYHEFFVTKTPRCVLANPPVIRDGRVCVVLDNGCGNCFWAAFDLASGDQVWRSERAGMPLWGPPIVVGDLAFGYFGKEQLECRAAKSGEIKYSENFSSTSLDYTSPVSDGRHIYIASEIGQVYVVPVADKFSVAAMNPLHEVCMATPAIGDGAIYFRTENHLIAVGAKR